MISPDPALTQARQDCPVHSVCADDVRIQLRQDLFWRDGLVEAAHDVARVVHDDVEMPRAAFDGLDCGRDRTVVRDVQLDDMSGSRSASASARSSAAELAFFLVGDLMVANTVCPRRASARLMRRPKPLLLPVTNTLFMLM